MFADDMWYHLKISTTADCATLQTDVCAITEWTEQQDLQLNVTKTKAMMVSRKRCPPDLNIEIGDLPIECVSFYRYLGFTISSNLSWSLHINPTWCKAKRLVGFLYRQFCQADSHCLNRLYKSIILPILNYGASVWNPYHVTYINKLDRVQEFAAKVVTRNCDQEVVYCWLSLSQPTRLATLAHSSANSQALPM